MISSLIVSYIKFSRKYKPRQIAYKKRNAYGGLSYNKV